MFEGAALTIERGRLARRPSGAHVGRPGDLAARVTARDARRLERRREPWACLAVDLARRRRDPRARRPGQRVVHEGGPSDPDRAAHDPDIAAELRAARQ
eukprot:7071501-Prymnesium_polylepis.1